MRIVEFEQTHGTVWVNPMFVQTIRAGREHDGTDIRLYGQESWTAVRVAAKPDEVARRLSEAMT